MSEDPRYARFQALGGTLSYAVWLQVQAVAAKVSAQPAAQAPVRPVPAARQAPVPTPAPPSPPTPILSTPQEVQEFKAQQSQELRELNSTFDELDRVAGVDPKTAEKPKRSRARKSYGVEVTAQYFAETSEFRPMSSRMCHVIAHALGGLGEIDPSLSGIEIAGGAIRYALTQAGVSTEDAMKMRQQMVDKNVLKYNIDPKFDAERAIAQRIFTNITGIPLPLEPTPLPGTPEAEALRALLRQPG